MCAITASAASHLQLYKYKFAQLVSNSSVKSDRKIFSLSDIDSDTDKQLLLSTTTSVRDTISVCNTLLLYSLNLQVQPDLVKNINKIEIVLCLFIDIIWMLNQITDVITKRIFFRLYDMYNY